MVDENAIIEFLLSLKEISSHQQLKIFQKYLRCLSEDQRSRAENLFALLNEVGLPPPRAKKIVVLVHGIRTFAAWQGKVEKALAEFADVEVVKLKYFYFDLFRFIIPFQTRQKPVSRVLKGLQAVMRDNADAELIVVAHSFGSYIINRILRENSHISISKLLLCGSVVREDFDWSLLPTKPKLIVNDIGVKDKLPVLAKLSSWGYGISGSNGFGSYGVVDRFHNVGHSGFFDESNGIVNNYWLPFILNGRILKTDLDANEPTPNWLLSWASSFPQGTLIYAAIIILFFIGRAIFQFMF